MDNEYFTKVWRYCLITICLFMTLCFGSCQNTKLQVVRAITAGANPIAARCALSNESDRALCAFIAGATLLAQPTPNK